MKRNNSFDLVRHVAALMVLVSHHYVLFGYREPEFPGFKAYGTVAVIVFFVISGYLITKSMQRSLSICDFYKKRILRLYPALIVCSLVICFVIPFVYSHTGGVNISLTSMVRYFISIMAMIPYGDQSSITGGFIYNYSLNGSLWTLPIEVVYYLLISLCFAFKDRRQVITVLFFLSIILSLFIFLRKENVIFYSISLKHAAPMISSFMVGAVFSQSTSFQKPKSLAFLILVSSVLILASIGRQDFYLTAYFSISLLILSLSLLVKDKIINGRFDYSYGIYIYAFPVQQLVINELKLGFEFSLILSIVITILLAMFSWHFVEKRFLAKKTIKTNIGKDDLRSASD